MIHVNMLWTISWKREKVSMMFLFADILFWLPVRWMNLITLSSIM